MSSAVFFLVPSSLTYPGRILWNYIQWNSILWLRLRKVSQTGGSPAVRWQPAARWQPPGSRAGRCGSVLILSCSRLQRKPVGVQMLAIKDHSSLQMSFLCAECASGMLSCEGCALCCDTTAPLYNPVIIVLIVRVYKSAECHCSVIIPTVWGKPEANCICMTGNLLKPETSF